MQKSEKLLTLISIVVTSISIVLTLIQLAKY